MFLERFKQRLAPDSLTLLARARHS